MDHLNLHILTPNKHKKRFFGVDYFMNIATGYNPAFRYVSTPLDPNTVYKEGPVKIHPEMYRFLEAEISTKEKGSIIGIFQNPDIYMASNSLLRIIEILEKYEMGLFLETSSVKIFNDIEKLVEFSKKNPLLIGITTSNIEPRLNILSESDSLNNTSKILNKLRQNNLNCGMILKPIIPQVNDDIDSFNLILDACIQFDATFIYPTFTINFDSKKIKEFYNIIDLEVPNFMNYYYDKFGYKNSWETENASELKKNFVIKCKKHKVLYAMRDIINLYKPDLNIQMKLF